MREAKVYCELVAHDAPLARGRAPGATRVHPLRRAGQRLRGGRAALPRATSGPAGCRCWASATACRRWRSAGRRGAALEPAASTARPRLTSCSAEHPLFAGLPPRLPVWMSHGDIITRLPPGFSVLARTGNSPVAAMGNDALRGHPVPPRGHPHAAGAADSGQLPLQDVRLQRHLDAGLVRGRERRAHPRARSATARCSAPCPAASIRRWWRRLLHRAVGDQLDLRLRRQRPAAPGRGRERGRQSSAAR